MPETARHTTMTRTARRPETAATPVIVSTATKHKVISELMMALLARGVTTNIVSTSITNRAVKLYSCSQNRARLHAPVIVGQDRVIGGINLVSSLYLRARRAPRDVPQGKWSPALQIRSHCGLQRSLQTE